MGGIARKSFVKQGWDLLFQFNLKPVRQCYALSLTSVPPFLCHMVKMKCALTGLRGRMALGVAVQDTLQHVFVAPVETSSASA
eukprot:scaffold151102_cov18-Tisochrysis_lutea.AAC.5